MKVQDVIRLLIDQPAELEVWLGMSDDGADFHELEEVLSPYQIIQNHPAIPDEAKRVVVLMPGRGAASEPR